MKRRWTSEPSIGQTFEPSRRQTFEPRREQTFEPSRQKYSYRKKKRKQTSEPSRGQTFEPSRYSYSYRRKKSRQTSENRHMNPDYFKQRKTNLKKQQLLSDTGMDTICSSCIEWKSSSSCVHISKLPIERAIKYCT